MYLIFTNSITEVADETINRTNPILMEVFYIHCEHEAHYLSSNDNNQMMT